MLLKRRRRPTANSLIRAIRAACLALVPAVCLSLSACIPGHGAADGAAVCESPAGPVSMFRIRLDEPPQTAYRSEAPAAGRGIPQISLFRLRMDNSEAQRQAALADCPPEDPCAVPSYSELRKAKADAVAQAELKAQGGDTQIKPDGSSSNPVEVKFVASPGALGLEIQADKNLNTIEGLPHALVLVIYHLSDRTAFDQLASNTDGVLKLLEGNPFDASVKSVRQMFIQPGMHNVMTMERSEDGRYIAIVAGYNRPDPASSIFITSYGIGHYTKKNGVMRKSTDMFTPLPLNLRVILGSGVMTVVERGEIYRNVEDSVAM